MPTRRSFLQCLASLAAAEAAKIKLPEELRDDPIRGLVAVAHRCQYDINNDEYLHRWQVQVGPDVHHVDAALKTHRPNARECALIFQALADTLYAQYPDIRLAFPEAA